MKKVKILTDSCSDLSAELLAKYDIDYGRMNTVKNGTETSASLSWEYYSPSELYDSIRNGERVTTTQVPAQEFDRIFRKYLEEGFDIVYIGCSLKQSGSVNTASVVAAKLKEEYPDNEIYAIDSLNACMGEGILAIKAAELRNDGLSAKEINDKILPMRNFVNQYVTVNTLEYLKRAGRVKGAKAFFGNLMGIRPILISDATGEQTPVRKAKGRLNSLHEIVNLLKDSIVDPQNQTIYVAHADCNEQEVEDIKKYILENIPCKDVYVNYIGPIIGASIGPDAVGIWAFGKEVNYIFEG